MRNRPGVAGAVRVAAARALRLRQGGINGKSQSGKGWLGLKLRHAGGINRGGAAYEVAALPWLAYFSWEPSLAQLLLACCVR